MKNRRARLYIAADANGLLKLGCSDDPRRRSKQLGRPVRLLCQTAFLDDAERVETLAHRTLALHGTHIRGEWFKVRYDHAVLALRIAMRQASGGELELGGSPRTRGGAVVEGDGVFQMRVDASFGRMLDDLRKAQDDLPSRAELIRRLVEQAHAALGKKPAKR